MKYEQMKQILEDIDLLEKDLMRDLTEEEKDIIVDKGWKSYLNSLNLTDGYYKTFTEMKKVISDYYTTPYKDFKNNLKSISPSTINGFRFIIGEYDSILDSMKEKKYPLEDYIKRLKNGETLELPEETIDKIVEELWSKENNIRIEVKNNKICLK